jgi:CBS domain-containing protein
MPTVSDVMRQNQREPVAIRSSATVMDAVKVMNANRVGAVLVMDGSRVAGIFTERDVLTRVVATERSPRDLSVADVMTKAVLCCRLDTDLDEVAVLMQSQRIRHLPILDADDVPIGMISIGDINAFHVRHKQATIENLSSYIHGRG